ncbi:DNA polymerase I [Cereibacter sphaeroides]|uniref:DNA polymerase n=1 Tax=Cereibacter sphaeroides TaxID=1063 RepID=UPI000F54100C|nr:DNA polymerase [Cereibacter sphaeroides]AZB55467.1 DNA polymerase I [Cereibacter sphaeroides]AZB59734.1 DNA polymerase I [Cereibacter sphaeroides]
MSLALFTFVRNFSDEEKSRFFMSDAFGFREVEAADVAAQNGLLICHDFWMISRAIFKRCGSLPARIVDLDEFHILTSRDPEARRRREKYDVIDRMSSFLVGAEDTLISYKRMLYQDSEVDTSVQERFHNLLLVYYIELCRRAVLNGEFERFFRIEVPCAAMCAKVSSRGIKVDTRRISAYRKLIKHDFYEGLKDLSDSFDVPLEVPTDKDVERYARRQGVDVDEYGLDFTFSYLPQIRPYAVATQKVRELSAAREVLESIPVKSDRVFPTIDTQGSRTSRISVRSPFLQSLPKRYRDIINPDPGTLLSYVDFDQFEVGIMAALSGDPILHSLFMEQDMYESFRLRNLDGQGSRKAAKILFLAYAYGMKRRNLPIVGASFGLDHLVVREAFRQFTVFERWKQQRLSDFDDRGFVATSLGNRFYRFGTRATKKEKLSAISQIVQGEGSLIFKKALLRISNMQDAGILLPMHDAVLFQHQNATTPVEVVIEFAETMTQHFGGDIKGKASVESFFLD